MPRSDGRRRYWTWLSVLEHADGKLRIDIPADAGEAGGLISIRPAHIFEKSEAGGGPLVRESIIQPVMPMDKEKLRICKPQGGFRGVSELTDGRLEAKRMRRGKEMNLGTSGTVGKATVHSHSEHSETAANRKRRREQSALNGNDVLKQLKLIKYAVRDDGWCWLYVVMAAMGLYDAVPFPKRTCAPSVRAPNPTPKELARAKKLCASYLPGTKAPDYEGKRRISDFFGAYGGSPQWEVLAAKLDLIIIEWDPRRMAHLDAKFQCITSVGSRDMTAGEILVEVSKSVKTGPKTVVHVVWSVTIERHFDVYL